jgi:tetratricopeptide (TPR) repeat protein
MRTHATLARGWYIVGLVRGLWAGRIAQGEEALERARAHARAAGDRRQEADIVGRLGFAAWSGPMPVHDAIGRCAALLEVAPDDLQLEACCRRWIGCLVARQGRFDVARELMDAAVAAYEELGARLDAANTAAFGRADVEWLAGDFAAAERALRDGFDTLNGLGEQGHRASVAALLGRVLHAQGRGREAELFARVGRETASDLDIWSQVLSRLTQALVLADRGQPVEAEDVAREALGIVELTDLLELHGDALLDLAEVLRVAGRESESRESVEEALDFYLRKGNEVAADQARALLARRATKA